MNVLHINQSDITGGAAIAAYRLHQGLFRQNMQSRLLVDSSRINSDLVETISRRRHIEGMSSRIAFHLGLNYINLLSTARIPTHEFYIEADILNFHNLHGNYFNYLSIPKLVGSKPAVLTLHDMWSFTGHCAYSFKCERWRTGCGKCPDLDTYPAIARDNSALEWKLKDWVYSRSRLSIVTPSQWLSSLASQSLLSRYPIHTIPNGLDTQIYKPLDSQICRSALGLSEEKKVLLCAAQNFRDPRKGGDLILEALKHIPNSLKQAVVLLVLGEGSEIIEDAIDIPTVALGYLGGDLIKTIAYSAADIFVFPTRADNLPLVLQESMACGTPIVSFDVGGVPELVRPGITGLLAKAENAIDFSQKIVELIEDNSLRHYMSNQCRQIAVSEYSINLQAERYVSVYEGCIQDFN